MIWVSDRDHITALVLSVLLTACGEPDNRGESLSTLLYGLCESVGGGDARVTADSVSGCSDWSQDSPPATIDGDYGSFALLSSAADCPSHSGTATIRGTAQAGAPFAIGQSAGALIRLPAGTGVDTVQMTVRTYLDGVLMDSAVAVTNQNIGAGGSEPLAPDQTVNAGPRATRGPDGYYGIVTTREYDAVELQFDQTGSCSQEECGETRIYEICTR